MTVRDSAISGLDAGQVSDRLGLALPALAPQGLTAARARRQPARLEEQALFDEGYPAAEQLPRRFAITFTYVPYDRYQAGQLRVQMRTGDGRPIGDPLSDNAYEDTGYRFHDAIHLAWVALLGWSPVMRTLLGCRRASNPRVNEVEDGGRAKVIDEAITAFVFDYARSRRFLKGAVSVDGALLAQIQRLVTGLEVQARAPRDWEQAILAAFRVWRGLRRHDGGVVTGDLRARTLTFRPPEAAVPAGHLETRGKRARHGRQGTVPCG